LTLAALLTASTALAQESVRWSLAPAAGAIPTPGQTFNVEAVAEIGRGWHLYDVAQPPGGPTPTSFELGRQNIFRLNGKVSSSAPQRAFDSNFNLDTFFHVDRAVFTLPVLVAGDAASTRYPLSATVTYQVCNDRFCLPPRDVALQTDVVVGSSSPAGGAPPPLPRPAALGDSLSSGGSSIAPHGSVPDLSAKRASTLGAYIGLAAVMGALSLLTPCVFPMVPITVSYFTNRAGRSRREAVMQAVVYGLGIALTFTAVGFTIAVGFGASGLSRFAANPWLNLGVTALFVGFALSLFGIYDVALPSRVVTAAAKADAGRGRYAGTLLMGLAFTLTSFTCTAPFLGTLLVVASQGDWHWPLAGMLAFSAIFALPFVVLALAPQWMSRLPRSGAWLPAIKATMGLLELAAAMKFLSNVDLVWGWGIFTRSVVLVSWIALAIVLVVYLAGAARLGRAPRLGRPRPGRFAAIAAGIMLGVWLASGISGRRLGELEAFLPPADMAGRAHAGELSWIVNDIDAALGAAQRTRKPIFVDFSGYTCTNCRWMEANMFPREDVSQELARYVRLRVYTDGRNYVSRRYQQMEQQWFGTVALPYYAVLNADGQPIVAFGGLTRDDGEFVAFLRTGNR